MSTIKKLTASVFIICMFLHLPEPEARASESADDFVNAATSVDYQINDSEQADCTGIYSIFSPCYKLEISTIDMNGNTYLDKYDPNSIDQALFNDEDQILPWENESEDPQVGFLIPIIHF